LVSYGLAVADGFSGLRAMLLPGDKKRGSQGRRRMVSALQDAGRWSLLQGFDVDHDVEQAELDAVDTFADTLLRRYGVVFRRLLDRESLAPPWRQLLHVFRRREARGELRGGRFVAGFSGEQFALPEAVPLLRRLRKEGG